MTEKRVADLRAGDRFMVGDVPVTVSSVGKGFARYGDGKRGVMVEHKPGVDGFSWMQAHPDDLVQITK